MAQPTAQPIFETCVADTPDLVRGAQRLRYDVFVRELGATGALVDHAAGLEQDRFDAHARHLLLLDRARRGGPADQVVGVYRLMDRAGAQGAGGFYSAQEFDVTALSSGAHRLLELGRSCVHPDYRGGPAMYHLWAALARIVEAEQIDILFGVASFQGTDTAQTGACLRLLHDRHRAPEALRVQAKPPAVGLESAHTGAYDARAAMVAMPALIKAYLRLGGFVGDGAHLDHAFGTTDVCVMLDTRRMTAQQKAFYDRTRRS